MAVDAARIDRASALVSELVRDDLLGLSHEALMEVHVAAARLSRFTGTLGSRVSGEVSRRSTPDLPGGGLARRQGFGSAGQMVARVTGGTMAGAMRSIEAGRALTPDVAPGACLSDGSTPLDQSAPHAPRYPFVAEAALAGELSVDAAALITSGLETLTDRVPSERLHELEKRLVGKAVHLAAHEVRRLVATAVAHADVAGHEEREKRQHAERYVAWKEDHTGMVTFTGRLDAVTAAPIRTVIEQVVTQGFRARRDQDPSDPDQRTVGQMRADALALVCRHALGCNETDSSGIRTTIVVRMNKRDLDTGKGLGRIDGTDQPVSVGQLRRLAGDAGIIPEVLGGESELLDLGRTKRIFTRAQRIALVERDGGCAKCHAPPEHCEAHHIRWWEHGGLTDLSNGVMLCTRCHHDIHRQGWNIRIHAGRVEFIPPPQIDPSRQPIPGGLAAITTNTDDAGKLDPLADRPREKSAGEDAVLDTLSWESSVRKAPAWENSARRQPSPTDTVERKPLDVA